MRRSLYAPNPHAQIDPPVRMRYHASTMPTSERPDYGFDAPVVVRNLFLVAVAGVTAWTVTTFAALSGRFNVPRPVLMITGMGFTTGVGCALMACWMLWDSRIGKLHSRENLLNRLQWSGAEE